MIRSNRNLFRVFPTRVSPALRYPNKVVRYSTGLRTTADQIYGVSVLERFQYTTMDLSPTKIPPQATMKRMKINE